MMRELRAAAILALAMHAGAHAAEAPLAAQIMAGLAALPDRTARFTEERRLTSLAEPVLSSGRLVFRHPAHLEKITESPHPERVLIDAGTVTMTTPGAAPRSLALDAHPSLGAMAETIAAVLAGNLASLQILYTVEATGNEAAWRLTLSPRARNVAQFIRAVTLDGRGTDLRAVRIDQANGDTQAIAIQPAS